MIGVGINENVVLTKLATNDKGTLEITFDTLEEMSKPKTSVFASLQTAKVDNGNTSMTLNMFGFKKPDGERNKDKTVDELLDMVSQDMKTRTSQLTQLMEIYLTTEDINKVWNPFIGTGIDENNWHTTMLDNEALKLVWANFTSQTISLLTPFLGDIKYPLRLKLIRQSKDKHFATIPGRFISDNPFVELMEVPTPKVKFTPYEIKEGLNDGTPASRPDAAGGEASDAPPAEGRNVFGSR